MSRVAHSFRANVKTKAFDGVHGFGVLNVNGTAIVGQHVRFVDEDKVQKDATLSGMEGCLQVIEGQDPIDIISYMDV